MKEDSDRQIINTRNDFSVIKQRDENETLQIFLVCPYFSASPNLVYRRGLKAIRRSKKPFAVLRKGWRWRTRQEPTSPCPARNRTNQSDTSVKDGRVNLDSGENFNLDFR